MDCAHAGSCTVLDALLSRFFDQVGAKECASGELVEFDAFISLFLTFWSKIAQNMVNFFAEGSEVVGSTLLQ